MITIPKKILKKTKGIIVWDFDGVLFETKRQSAENRRRLAEIGISEKKVVAALERLERKNKAFSIGSFINELNHKKNLFSAQKIREILHNNLVKNRYYDPRVDRLLHRLRGTGFIQIILSLGNAQWQRKKMFIGCSSSFRKHFAKIYTTTRPKFLTLAKIKKRVPGMRIIFVDDTEENLVLAKKHVPEIITVYYSNTSGHSLESLEKKIISYAKYSQKSK